ncbi:MAG TPA: MFS transporter [Gemmatimonadaceae bacterium]
MTNVIQRFMHIRREEAWPVLVSGLAFFFILTALMMLKPAREALGLERGIEAIRWLFVGTAVVTLAVNPLFGLMVSRFRRLVFINVAYLFFAVSLLVFYGLLVMAPAAIGKTSGMVFFVWFSVFNLFATMIFWGVMADRFSLDQGKRLFGLITVGGSLGAIAGPWLASQLAKPLGTAALLPIAAGVLGLAMLSLRGVTKLQPGHENATIDERSVIGGSAWDGFRAVTRSPYLLGISAYVLIMTVFATFIYFTKLHLVAGLGDGLDVRTTVFAKIDLYTQITTMTMQGFVTGRVMKRLGVPFALTLLPITAGLGVAGLAVVASLAAIVVLQAAYNAVQRGIVRPARETLFTVVPRTDKYKSKAFIDTFVYRTGDVMGSQVEGALGRLGTGVASLISISLPLAVVWGALGFWLGRRQQRQAEHRFVPTLSAEHSAAAVPLTST